MSWINDIFSIKAIKDINYRKKQDKQRATNDLQLTMLRNNIERHELEIDEYRKKQLEHEITYRSKEWTFQDYNNFSSSYLNEARRLLEDGEIRKLILLINELFTRKSIVNGTWYAATAITGNQSYLHPDIFNIKKVCYHLPVFPNEFSPSLSNETRTNLEKLGWNKLDFEYVNKILIDILCEVTALCSIGEAEKWDMNIYINDRRRVADYYECESTPRIRSIKEITKKHVEFFVYYEEFFYSTTNKSVFDKASEYLKNNCPVQIIYDIYKYNNLNGGEFELTIDYKDIINNIVEYALPIIQEKKNSWSEWIEKIHLIQMKYEGPWKGYDHMKILETLTKTYFNFNIFDLQAVSLHKDENLNSKIKHRLEHENLRKLFPEEVFFIELEKAFLIEFTDTHKIKEEFIISFEELIETLKKEEEEKEQKIQLVKNVIQVIQLIKTIGAS
ncbi:MULTISPECIES: hypothetical protein [Enterococcus]|uniref:hypothetical protein n=1 Tax=Enterococcus TaxID=1350 RepID=UPI002091B5BE|nr:hypothetical protein [Enterococcus faecium]MCO5462507.1 hypothetical protein [Enterococcus faecium]MDQ8281596.1 hypothetical protein [Enterococcus faecium]